MAKRATKTRKNEARKNLQAVDNSETKIENKTGLSARVVYQMETAHELISDSVDAARKVTRLNKALLGIARGLLFVTKTNGRKMELFSQSDRLMSSPGLLFYREFVNEHNRLEGTIDNIHDYCRKSLGMGDKVFHEIDGILEILIKIESQPGGRKVGGLIRSLNTRKRRLLSLKQDLDARRGDELALLFAEVAIHTGAYSAARSLLEDFAEKRGVRLTNEETAAKTLEDLEALAA